MFFGVSNCDRLGVFFVFFAGVVTAADEVGFRRLRVGVRVLLVVGRLDCALASCTSCMAVLRQAVGWSVFCFDFAVGRWRTFERTALLVVMVAPPSDRQFLSVILLRGSAIGAEFAVLPSVHRQRASVQTTSVRGASMRGSAVVKER